jgi:hypothetical protein
MELQKSKRQGDVLVMRVDSIPANLEAAEPESGELVILAHGEVTGHHHSLPASNGRVTMYGHDEEGPRFIDVKRPTPLSHQEHDAIEFPTGLYEVIRQREYTPQEIRRVAD